MAKRLLTVFEYEKLTFEPLSQREACELNDRCEELRKYTKTDVLQIIHNKNNETIGIVAKQYVGVIQISSALSIQILPKLSANEAKEAASEECIQNILFMLTYCNKLTTPQANTSSLKTFKGDFFEILIHLFSSSLLTEIRNSLHHHYTITEQNLPYLKGKLLFGEHIRHNSITQDKFYLQSDEFSVDNPLNRIFKAVCSQLIHISKNHKNRRKLSELILMLEDVKQVPAYLSDIENIQLNRLNNRFKTALELAKLFVSGKSLQLQYDTFATMTFLIDMNVLFEEFISTVLKKALPENLILYTQGPMQYLVTAKQEADQLKENANIFQMKPDMSLAYKHSPKDIIQILDTKYKILDNEEKKMGVSQPDMYQMYAYANKYKTNSITMLYPVRHMQEVSSQSFYIDNNCTISIKTIDLQRDLRKSMTRVQQELLEMISF